MIKQTNKSSSEPVWSAKEVSGEPGLYSKIPPQKRGYKSGYILLYFDCFFGANKILITKSEMDN